MDRLHLVGRIKLKAWALLACAGCASGRPLLIGPHLEPLVNARYCSRTTLFSQAHEYEHQAIGPTDELLGTTGELPPDVARVARAGKLMTSETRHQRLLRLLSLKNEISAALAEVDCLGDSLEDLQAEIIGRAHVRELGFTLASIGVSVVAGIAAGVVELMARDSASSPIVAISGGVGSAALGVAAVSLPTETVDVVHQENVLADIWFGTPSGALSPFVWRLLDFSRGGGLSPRQMLALRWTHLLHHAAPEADERRALERLLFGPGGNYTLNALRTRELLLDTLETEIALMNQDLELLVRQIELEDRKSAPPTTER